MNGKLPTTLVDAIDDEERTVLCKTFFSSLLKYNVKVPSNPGIGEIKNILLRNVLKYKDYITIKVMDTNMIYCFKVERQILNQYYTHSYDKG